jgi:2,4-dienoyl-CoA reductase-like NADH-dependent reductase (Old Yellow Enzyme family)
MSHLFEPLTLREVTLRNRIGIPPMCQYSAQDGMASDWHMVHYGSRAVGGAGLLIVEATAVTAIGRISPGDLGLWKDDQIAPLAAIARFLQTQGCVPAIQLAHAGRKASVGLGWGEQRTLRTDEGGWVPVAPSSVPFGEGYIEPHALSLDEIGEIPHLFAAAAKRALAAGFSAVELHAAHGYLLHQFLSPLANRRSDGYGGNFANRTRLLRDRKSVV